MSKMIDVSKHGLRPNAQGDQTGALTALLDEAMHAGGDVQLFFPAGRYEFSGPLTEAQKQDAARFTVRGARRVRLEGESAQLMFDSFEAGAFRMEGCEQVSITGLQIDWLRPPFSMGTVEDAQPRWFDFRASAEFPITGALPVQALNWFDPLTGAPQRGGVDLYWQVERTELIEPQLLRVHLLGEHLIPPGQLFALRHQVYGRDAFMLERCRDVLVRDTTVLTCPGMGAQARNSHNLCFERFDVRRPAPGSVRLFSCAADATHFMNCSGELSLRDCFFENSGDDASNTYSIYMNVVKREGARTLIIDHAHAHLYPLLIEAGDRLEFYNPHTLVMLAQGKIKTVTLEPQAKQYRLEMDKDLAPEVDQGALLADATRNPRLHIDRCRVRGTRGRGFLLTTRGAVVENCDLENLQCGGVLLAPDNNRWRSAIGVHDAVIRNNRFTNCNAGPGSCEGEITTTGYVEDWQRVPAPLHQGVRIEDNTITRTGQAALFIGSVQGAVVRGNTIQGCCMQPDRAEGYGALWLDHCRQVKIENNRLTWDRARDTAFVPVKTGPDVQMETITFEDNQGLSKPEAQN